MHLYMAVVYFGEPFVGLYYTFEMDELRPATPEECWAYTTMCAEQKRRNGNGGQS